MIRILSLHIEQFRGIHKLTLEPDDRNYAVCGPNGTGKSGVVDALEFVITGSISRLMGEGTSSITLKSHAPHVDSRETPEVARVSLTAFIPSLKKTVTIERCVDNPHAPKVTPPDPDVVNLVKELEDHPEFALSRREIIKYVLATPGDRSREIQALLRLDRIEKVRQSFQTIVNSRKTDSKKSDQDVTQAQAHLVRALGITSLGTEHILAAVNSRRDVLHLEPLPQLLAATSLKAWVTVVPEQQRPRQKIAKKQALIDLGALSELLKAPETELVSKSRNEIAAIVEKLLKSPSLLRSLRKQDFLRSGLDLIDTASCPFCDTQWNVEELRRHVQDGLDKAHQATALKLETEKAAMPLNSSLRQLETLARAAVTYGRQATPAIDTKHLDMWVSSLEERREQILKLEKPEDVLANLAQDYRELPKSVATSLDEIRQSVESLPDPSKEDEAKEYLTVCQERLDVYRVAKRKQAQIKKDIELAAMVLDTYNATVTDTLDDIYAGVATDFATYYRFINRDDESAFEGKLTPAAGRLNFDVDFYGRGFFPPSAYHSEGHQDAMGLCLYLALMKHTLAHRFCFAVLDDVLMSVDAGHRREVCSMLKSEFPETQFIITTHDEIWLKHMISEHLIDSKAFVQFRKWTIDDGPLVWNGADAWKEIGDYLDVGRVDLAAGTLRRYLEYMGRYLSERLRARIEFRGDAHYDLGELFGSVIQSWRDLLRNANKAANSWNKREELERIGGLQEKFARLVDQSQVEQWAINKSIHYNAWANFQKNDFAPVVNAFREFLEAFVCSSCRGYLYVLPTRGAREEIRCDCGAISLNLRERP